MSMANLLTWKGPFSGMGPFKTLHLVKPGLELVNLLCHQYLGQFTACHRTSPGCKPFLPMTVSSSNVLLDITNHLIIVHLATFLMHSAQQRFIIEHNRTRCFEHVNQRILTFKCPVFRHWALPSNCWEARFTKRQNLWHEIILLLMASSRLRTPPPRHDCVDTPLWWSNIWTTPCISMVIRFEEYVLNNLVHVKKFFLCKFCSLSTDQQFFIYLRVANF